VPPAFVTTGAETAITSSPSLSVPDELVTESEEPVAVEDPHPANIAAAITAAVSTLIILFFMPFSS
jgi:hypothetical protein